VGVSLGLALTATAASALLRNRGQFELRALALPSFVGSFAGAGA